MAMLNDDFPFYDAVFVGFTTKSLIISANFGAYGIQTTLQGRTRPSVFLHCRLSFSFCWFCQVSEINESLNDIVLICEVGI